MLACLIVEDEPLAADVLQEYITKLPFLTLSGKCTNALDALEFIRNHSIDILFLDIHLPGLKGIDFLRTLKNPPSVILTTAYHQYAVESYELNVVDYLLKPIEFRRFVEAVNKIKVPHTEVKVISIHEERKTVLIPADQIVYVESQKEYIRIQSTESMHTTKYSLTKFEEVLGPKHFLRIHRSFIIALQHVKAFNAQEVDVPGKTIPIGANYQEIVLDRLGKVFHS